MKTLFDVQVGDRVILKCADRFSGAPQPVVVEQVTANRIRAGCSYRDTWFDRRTGRGVVGCGRLFPRSIRLPNPGELETHDQDEANQAAAEQAAAELKAAHEATEPHQLASRIGWTEHDQWERLPVEQLRQIVGWLKALPEKTT